jgi:hypothetical protein
MQGRTARRGALVGVLTSLGLAVAAPAALAQAEVQLVGGNLQFNADPGQTNVLTVTRTADGIAFDDANHAITESEATCEEAGGNVTCTFAAGQVNVFLEDGNDTVTFAIPNEDDIDPFADGEGGNDTLNAAAEATELDGGPGTDVVNGGPEADDIAGEGDADTLNGGAAGDAIAGGPGNDTLHGGAGGDTLNGDADDDALNGDGGDDALMGGPGADTNRGGDGEDSFFGASEDPGADQLIGDAGIDDVYYDGEDEAPNPDANLPVTVTLDGQPNDGMAGEGDNAQVEDVEVDNTGTGSVTNRVTGDAGQNDLLASSGQPAVLDGGAGNDRLTGGGGADTFAARDGFADRIACGGGADTVTADGFDQVAQSCEAVDAQGTAFATEDRPPTIAFVAPAAGATLNAAAPTPVTVTASDDRGIARVVLVDDGQEVGQSTAAPYTIAYQPRGGDVGVNQLAVVAHDTAGQTTTAFRTVRVNRFTPRSLSVRFTPARDRTLPFRFTTSGTLNLPSGGLVSRAQGCRGVVSVQVKRGSRTISTRRATLQPTCTYSSTVVFRDTTRTGRRGALKVTVRFLGNEVLARRSASPRSFRIGR